MSNQLVMYEEELNQIQEVCDKLHRDANAQAVLVIDKNGQAIAQAGDVDHLDVTSLSSLTAGNVAATGGIASLLEEKEFAGQFHEGERTNVHISIVHQRVILLVLFDERSSLGLVRLRGGCRGLLAGDFQKGGAGLHRPVRQGWKSESGILAG